MFFADRERKIDDPEQRKHERLHRTDEEVEKLDKERHDGDGDERFTGPIVTLATNDRRDDDEEQFADEDVEKETRRERRRARELFEDVDRRERPKRLEQMPEWLTPFCRKPTIQVRKNTSNASGTVVLRSAVGEPPKGSPNALNGSMPN